MVLRETGRVSVESTYYLHVREEGFFKLIIYDVIFIRHSYAEFGKHFGDVAVSNFNGMCYASVDNGDFECAKDLNIGLVSCLIDHNGKFVISSEGKTCLVYDLPAVLTNGDDRKRFAADGDVNSFKIRREGRCTDNAAENE